MAVTARRPWGAWAAGAFAIVMVLAVRGAVLGKLWAWYVVPLGAPRLGWLDAMGLSLVAIVLQRTPSGTDGKPPLTGPQVLGQGLASCTLLLLALALGAVVAVAR